MTAEILDVNGKKYIQLNGISGGVEIVDSVFYASLVKKLDECQDKLADEVKKNRKDFVGYTEKCENLQSTIIDLRRQNIKLREDLDKANNTISELALSSTKAEQLRASAFTSYNESIKEAKRGRFLDGVYFTISLLLSHPKSLRHYVNTEIIKLLSDSETLKKFEKVVGELGLPSPSEDSIEIDEEMGVC